VKTHTSGTDSQKRIDTATSGGAVMSFVTGGPRPQITMTLSMTAPAAIAEGSAPWPIEARLRSAVIHTDWHPTARLRASLCG